MNKIMWNPSSKQVKESNLYAYIQYVNNIYSLELVSYDDLYTWSIENIEHFWDSLWDFFKIKGDKSNVVLTNPDIMEKSRWFPQASLNFAENLLRFRDDNIALISLKESGERIILTYNELYDEVSKLSQAFRDSGIKPGDRIAGLLPNSHYAIIAMLATTAIGAIWSSTSPDFGIKGILDRFKQIEPKILLTVDGYTYTGKSINILDHILEIQKELPSLKMTVISSFLKDDPIPENFKNTIKWEELIHPYTEEEILFTPFPFNHPVYIMYSSGTTGLPKSIVHGAGGTLLQHLKELKLHTDIKREDKFFYYTTCGWMMWNWLVSALATGATLVLYDGSPGWPGINRLFNLIDEEKISVFGTSAKFISTLEKSGYSPRNNNNLESLRTILSTGSPLSPESFDFVYKHIKTEVCLSSISGGTDIISCFALGNPVGPVRRGELQVRGLGLAVEVYDHQEKPVIGQKGELVCTRPFPSMPIQFWNDNNGSRYHEAYFDKYYNVWHHGDFAEITHENGVIIYGRSDSVLNPGGVRIGTAEIYRIVESREEVLESVCVGQEWKGDIRVVLFVVLREKMKLDDNLIQELKNLIRENATPRHVPAKILQIKEVPRTINGKISEKAVKLTLHDQEVDNLEALANPESLDQFRNIRELKTNEDLIS